MRMHTACRFPQGCRKRPARSPLGGLCRGLRRRLAACADLLQEIERRRKAGGELHRPVDRGQRCDPITQIAQGLATIDIAEWVFRIETDRHVVIGERLGIPALQCQRRAAVEVEAALVGREPDRLSEIGDRTVEGASSILVRSD